MAHEHYSGYVPSPPRAGHGYFYGYGRSSPGYPVSVNDGRSPSPLKSPVGASARFPSTFSTSPPTNTTPTAASGAGASTSGASHRHHHLHHHGPVSKKLDNLFKHLVKWGSPGKDKMHHHPKHSTTSTSSTLTTATSVSTSTSGSSSSSTSSSKPAPVPTTTTTPLINITGTASPPYNISTTPTKCTPNVHHAAYYWACRRRSGSCASDRSSYDEYNNNESEEESQEGGGGSCSRESDELYEEDSGAEGEYSDEDVSYLRPGDSNYRWHSRSKSVDIAPQKKQLRGRRYSEGTPRRDSSTQKTYTIYEAIIKERGGRRSSVNFHRPSDAHIDAAHAAILFRDARGLPQVDPFLEKIAGLCGENEENEILVKFFRFHKCYDLIPTSAKLVVFDTQLLVKKAFFALVYNGVRAAPLWDSTERKIVGMLTITDFIRVLHAMYHDSNGSTGKMSELEEHRVETWRKRFLLNRQPLVFIDPDASLYEAICSLVNNRIHRLPVIDQHTGNVLHILTHKRILKFLFLYINEIPRPSFLNKQLREVKIGSFDKIETAKEDTPIITALQKFLDRRVSALPIVDDQNRLQSIYARFDVINLAAEKTYSNLDITLKQANEHRNEWFEGVHKSTLDETLFVVMDRIVKAEVHRLVVVDEEDRVTGVISLSDILQYLVMRPELKEINHSNIKVLNKQNVADAAGQDGLHDSNIIITPSAIAIIEPQSQNHQARKESDSSPSDVNRGQNADEDEQSEDAEREHPTICEEDDEKT